MTDVQIRKTGLWTIILIMCGLLLFQLFSLPTISFAAEEDKEEDQKVTIYKPDLDNIKWKYHRQAPGSDTSDLDIPVKKTADGKGLEIDFTGLPIDGVAYDTDAPDIKDGEIEYKLEIKGEKAVRLGFVLRHAANDNYSMLNYDAGGWGWQKRVDNEGPYGSVDVKTNAKLETGVEYDIKIKYKDNQYTLWVDGEKVIDGTYALSSEAGQFGVRNWFTGNRQVILKDIVYKEYEEAALPDPKPVEEQVIESKTMNVVLDNNYPRVLRYEWKEDGSVLAGQENYVHTIALGGDEYFIDHVDYQAVGKDQMDYKIHVQNRLREEGALEEGEKAEIRAIIDVSMKVEDNQLTMDVTNIEEKIGRITTLEFLNNYYVTVKETEDAGGTFIRTSGNWHELDEIKVDLKDEKATGSKHPTSYGTIYDGDFAVSIENNAIDTSSLLSYSSFMDGDTKALAFGDGIYTYRHNAAFTSEWADNWEAEELPTSTVIIGKDQNKDGKADWQDGAILLREIMDVPLGGDEIKNHVSYIAFNIGSHAQSNFLYSLDVAKLLSNYYDGFGQMMLQKGYQSEGHDDSIPDYGGHIGVHQGGKKDFNILLDESEKLNVKVGVHVNLTEYMLDAFYTPIEFLTNPPNYSNGWGWIDQAYYVDQTKDLLSKQVYDRFDQLKADAPGLDWVYVDVYTGAGWNAKKVAEKIQDNGWWAATEFRGPMEQDAIWTHWGTDVLYPVGDIKTSEFYRMVRNGTQDTHVWDELLKGVQQASVSSWQGAADMKEGMHVFYNNNLATKYMQHFGITKMDEDKNFVEFDNGEVVVVKETNKELDMGERVNLYKNDKLIASLPTGTMDFNKMSVSYSEAEKLKRVYSKVFIPWDPVEETKIYHWNPFGGESTWELPDSWADQTEIKLYSLDGNGRTDAGTIPVKNGKVTIDAETDVPYIVLKGDDTESIVESATEKDNKWGEGSLVKDPSFNSIAFKGEKTSAAWERSAEIDTVDHVQNKLDHRYQGIMEISGADGAGGTVSQEITGLKPGKDYILGVWTDVTGDRKATAEVDFGYHQFSGTTENTQGWRNRVGEHKMSNTYYQRMSVRFTVPEGETTATIKLSASDGAADSVVKFEDLRLYETPTAYDDNGHWVYEDYENLDQDFGPFVHATNSGSRVHMAEYNPDVNQYQVNVIDGNWSLKLNQGANGTILRTIDSTVKFEKDTKYKVGFDYATGTDKYEISLFARTGDKVEKVAVQKLDRTTEGPLTTPTKGRLAHDKIEWEFTTGTDADEYYLGINTPNQINSIEYEYMLLDNFYIDYADVNAEAIAKVTAAIEALPEAVTEKDRGAVEKIITQYGELNGTEQARVAGYDQLIAALKVLFNSDGEGGETPTTETIADLKEQLKALEAAEEIKDAKTNRALTTHLTAVERYEKQEEAAKIVKHMESFKLLLDHYETRDLISEKAHQALTTNADRIIKRWE